MSVSVRVHCSFDPQTSEAVVWLWSTETLRDWGLVLPCQPMTVLRGHSTGDVAEGSLRSPARGPCCRPDVSCCSELSRPALCHPSSQSSGNGYLWPRMGFPSRAEDWRCFLQTQLSRENACLPSPEEKPRAGRPFLAEDKRVESPERCLGTQEPLCVAGAWSTRRGTRGVE